MEEERILKALKEGQSVCDVLEDVKMYLGPVIQKKVAKKESEKYGVFSLKVLRHCVQLLAASTDDLDDVIEMCRLAHQCTSVLSFGSTNPMLLDKLLFHVVLHTYKYQRYDDCLEFSSHLYKQLCCSRDENPDCGGEIDNIAKQSFNCAWKAAIDIEKSQAGDALTGVSVMVLEFRTSAVRFALLSTSEVSWVVEQASKAVAQFMKSMQSSHTVLHKCYKTVFDNMLEKFEHQLQRGTLGEIDIVALMRWTMKCTDCMYSVGSTKTALTWLGNHMKQIYKLCTAQPLKTSLQICSDILHASLNLALDKLPDAETISLLQSIYTAMKKYKSITPEMFQVVLQSTDLLRKVISEGLNCSDHLSKKSTEFYQEIIKLFTLCVDVHQRNKQITESRSAQQQDTNKQMLCLDLVYQLLLQQLPTKLDLYSYCLPTCHKTLDIISTVASGEGGMLAANERAQFGVHCYNLAVVLYKDRRYVDCLPLLLLSCQQIYEYCSTNDDRLDENRADKMKLRKKYELLIDCQRKTESSEDAIKTAVSAISLFGHSVKNFVVMFVKAKHDLDLSTPTLKDYLDSDCHDVYQLEYEVYKEQSYDTSVEQYSVLHGLLDIYNVSHNNKEQRAYYLLQLSKLSYQADMVSDKSANEMHECCEEAMNILEDITSESQDDKILDLLAVVYVWNYIIHQTKFMETNIIDETTTDVIDITCDIPNEIHQHRNLDKALDIWKNCKSHYVMEDTCEAMTVLSSIYKLSQREVQVIHCLQLLGKFAAAGKLYHTATMAYAEAAKFISYHGNLSHAHTLLEQSKSNLSFIYDNSVGMVELVYKISYGYYLLYSKQFSSLERLLLEIEEDSNLERSQRWAYLLKAECKELRCNYIQATGVVGETPQELEYDVMRLRQGVESLTVNMCTGNNKVEWGVDMWSVRYALLQSLYQIGYLYNIQGAYRESKCYLLQGLLISDRLALPIRCVHFLVELAMLSSQAGKAANHNYLLNAKNAISGKSQCNADTDEDDDDDNFIISKPISTLNESSDDGSNQDLSPSLEWSPVLSGDVIVNRVQLLMLSAYIDYLKLRQNDLAIRKVFSDAVLLIDHSYAVLTDTWDNIVGKKDKNKGKGKKKIEGAVHGNLYVDPIIDVHLRHAEICRIDGNLNKAGECVKKVEELCKLSPTGLQEAKMLFQKSLVLLQIEAQKNGCSVQELLANVWKIKTQQSANTEEEDDLDAITKKLEECSINGTDPNTKMKNKVKMMKKTEKLTSKKSIKILDDARDTMATGGDTELDGEPNTVLKLSSFDIGRLEMLTQSAKKISSSSRQNAARAQGSKTLHQYVSENEDFIEYSPTKIIVEHNGSTEYDFQTTDETKPKKKTRAKTRKKMIEYSASDSENTETCENEKQDQMKRRPTRCKVKPRNNDTYEHLDLENKAVKMTSKQRNVARSCKVVIDIHKDEVEKDKCSGGRSRRNARGGSKDMKESSRNTRKGKTLKEVCYEDEDEMLHDGKDVYDLSDSESDEAWQPENKKQTRRRNTKSSKKSLEVEDNRVTVERSMPARRGRPRKNVTKEEIVLEVPKEKRKGRVRATRTENVERVRDEGGHGNDDYHDEEDEVLDLSMDDFNRNSSGIESPQLCTSLHRKKLSCINIENELSQVLLTGLQGCYLSDTNDLQLCPLDNDADDEIDDIELVRGNDSDIEADNHLILPKKRTSKCRQLNSAAMTSHVDLSAIIDLLKTAYTLCLSTVPMKLFRDICHTLVKCTGDSQPYQSVYYLQQSSAVTLRHQKLANIYKKLRKLKKERSDPKKITRLEEENQCFVWKEKDIDASIDETVQCLPPGWRVCNITVIDNSLLLSVLQEQSKPIVLRIPLDKTQGDILRDISDQFRQIQVENKNMKETNKKKWWKIREDLNTRLKALLSNMENELLGCWKVLLLGRSEDEQIAKHITMVTAKFTKLYKLEAMQSQLLQYLLHGMTWLDRYHIMSGLSAVTGIPMNSDELNTMCNEILTLRDEIDAKFEMKSIKRCPVILVLDKHVQQLPWESLSIINASKQSISRMPSIQFILSHLQERSNEHSVLSHGVNPSKTSYVVNPSGDLANTQKAFEDWFKKVEGWSGISGRIPTSDEYKAALLNNDLFIYCGHGNGGQYLSGDDILRLQCNSVSLLMGCSSGQLDTNNSDMEATGMVLNYLLAGCPCVVGNLWSVTDRDIDRYLETVLKSWLKGDGQITDLLYHINQARNCCKMPYLIGAAPVAYGLPVHVRM